MTLGGRLFVAVVTIALSLFLLVAWSPAYIQTAEGDPAYTYAYHHLFVLKAQYGLDVVHTGGPWSIIYFQEYHPDTFWLLLAGQAVTAAALAMALLLVVLRHLDSFVVRLGVVLGALAMFSVAIDARYFFICLAAILFMPDFRERRMAPAHVVLYAVVALAMLVKISFLVAGFFVFGLLLAAELLRARRFPVNTLLFAAIFVSLGLAAGQGPAALTTYVTATLDLASGYPEHLSELGSYVELIAFFALAVPAGLLILGVEVGLRRWWGLVIALAYGVVLFGAYKQGFLRQDGQHVIRPFCTLLPFIACYVLVHRRAIAGWWARRGRDDTIVQGTDGPRGLSLAAVLFGGTAAALLLGYFLISYPSFYNTKLDRLVAQWNGFRDTIVDRSRLEERHEAAREAIRRAYPLPRTDARFAVFSSLQTVGIAHGEGYVTLPTTAAQLLWTPRLDAMDERFFSGPERPSHVFGDVPYADRLTGLALLANYRPAGFVNGHYWLARGEPQVSAVEQISQTTARFGEAVPVPAAGGDLIWAELDYRRTLLGSLVSLFYQPPPVFVVGLAGDRRLFRRLIAARLARENGYRVAPALGTPAAFAAFTTPEGRAYLRQRPVSAIRVEAGESDSWLFPLESWQRYFEPEIGITFYRLTFSPDLGGGWSDSNPAMAAFARLLALRPAATDGAAAEIVGIGDRAAIAATPDMPMKLELADAASRLEVGFGVRRPAQGPIRFRVRISSAVNPEPREIWTQKLTPEDAADQPIHRVNLLLDSCAGQVRCTVHLTVEEDDPSPQWRGFWSDVKAY